MNLKELISIGAIIPQDFVKKAVTWNHVDENRKKVAHTFDIHIKRFASMADMEFINQKKNVVDDDQSYFAARANRFVRLGETGTESISLETALTFDPGLLLVFNEAIKSVELENAPVESEDEKK